MRLLPHRCNLVVWSQSASSGGRRSAGRPTVTRRIRRRIRIGALLTVIGLIRLARAVRPRWRPLLAGTVLTVVGVLLRSGAGGVALLPGLLFLVYGLLIPASPEADRARRSKLARELGEYSTPAQRCDLEATLDQYPDRFTDELREILAGQAVAAYNRRFPAVGRY